MNEFLRTPVEYLKGVGPKRAKLLNKELNVFTFEHLLDVFPFRYVDRSQFYHVADVVDANTYVQLKGKIIKLDKVGTKGKQRLVALFEDETGTLELVWFKGIKYLQESLKINSEWVVFGKPSMFNNKINIAHPEMESLEAFQSVKSVQLQPVYHSTEKLGSVGLNSRGIWKLQRNLSQLIGGQIPETLSNKLLETLKIPGREDTYKQIHMPTNVDLLKRAQIRQKFEELFFLQLRLLRQNRIVKEKSPGVLFEEVGGLFNGFYKNHLPFDLTDAQKRVLREIRHDTKTGKQMNRLLQGDVGSGKTIVAVLAMLLAIDNGFQACIMAPTEILANQHAVSFRTYLEPLGVKVALLTGSTKQSERSEMFPRLESGEIQVIIGTHALLEDPVRFQNLGLSIIDEQHRFGVAQRAKLWAKVKIPPHVLVMTATPIPRTLAMTLYGDLDISVIDELPPGRKPITTVHYYESARLRVFGFIEQEVAKGRQVYIVYPLIEESEKMDYKDLMDGYHAITRRFQAPDYQVGVLHGRMKATDKDFEMQRFVKGETHIMVATTVIEVGVNVPNATVMIVESAERFGLSQLHQLRGRVGRGADKSYCVLMTGNKLTSDARTRIEAMVRTNDGFEIAEVDLRLRGPGDIEGTQQSGISNLRMADIVKDGKLMTTARTIATTVLDEDPELKEEYNAPVLRYLKTLQARKGDWSRIS